MTEDVKVPEVGESITEGMLTAWLRDEGAMVGQGDPLFELETDKITMEVPSPHAGQLHILVPAGETVRVGQVVARLDGAAAAEDAEKKDPPAAPPTTTEGAPTEPKAARPTGGTKDARPPTLRGVPGFGPSAPAESARIPAKRTVPEPGTPQAPASAEPDPRERLPLQRRPTNDLSDLSPAVRRLVTEHRLSPEAIGGTGPGGRLTKADVLAYLEADPQAPSDALPAAGVPGVGGEAAVGTSGADRRDADRAARDEPPRLAARPPAASPAVSPEGTSLRQTRARMSPLRARIAERLLAAKRDTAMLTTFNEVDMSAVLELRERFKGPFEKKHGVRMGFMSFFVKASVDALMTVPQVNAFIEGNEIVTNHFYDIGVAVGTDRGLVVPVVRGCDRLSFAGIEQAIADYARKVKEKKIGLDDLQGGSFTLSNGGVYGSLLSTPILNPPQSAILGMHAIKKRPVVVDDEIVIRPMMYLALSYDHRLVDGKNAVTFLRRIVDCLEAPERMLMDV